MSDINENSTREDSTIPDNVWENLREFLLMDGYAETERNEGQETGRRPSLIIKRLKRRRGGIIGIKTPGKNFTIKNGKWVLWVRFVDYLSKTWEVLSLIFKLLSLVLFEYA